MDLLRAYAFDADGAAFARLVQRHSGWIFAGARRRVRDDQLADDVTQAVFVILAGKATTLAASKQQSLAAWLFHVTRLASTRTLRTRTRQARRVDGASHFAASLATRSPSQATTRPILDDPTLLLLEDAIAGLPRRDRELLVRRFYGGESFEHIARSSKAVSADALRKRAARALTRLRQWMLREGVDVLPEELIAAHVAPGPAAAGDASARDRLQRRERSRDSRVLTLAEGTTIMAEQQKQTDFPVVSAEFYVKDVEANVAFFEKLGFTPRWREQADAMGRLPRASLAGGAGRIWLRRADETESTRPSPGVAMFFWINGGPDALVAHRSTIAAAGVPVSPFADDHTLRRFTVTTPDGYEIGFFTSYR